MKKIDNKLHFSGDADATVYFFLEHSAAIGFEASNELTYVLSDCDGERLSSGKDASGAFSLIGEGNFRLTFIGSGRTAEISLFCDDGVLPYLMPGVGVLWEHGGVFPLTFSKGVPHSVWLICPEGDRSESVAVIKGVDFGESTELTVDGVRFDADWYPKLDRAWFWHSAQLPEAKVIRFDLPITASDVRVTAYNRTTFALCEPNILLPFGALMPTVSDFDGKLTDARIEVFVGDERVAMCDKLVEDEEPMYLPFGRYKIRASHGVFFGESEAYVTVGEAWTEINLTVEEKIKLPNGWVSGELHTHSALEDATLFPAQVMRAARACGRQFCFMTDKNVEILEKYGMHKCDKTDVFVAFPGQEIMCHELHTNVLNPSHTVSNPEADDLTKVNSDIEDKITGWLSEYREMKKDGPCLIMHNHPTHRAEVAKRGQPYFRSWWVSDVFSNDYHLVENCGFEGWFDRLNRGKKLYAAWTGDGHDCTLMYPGMEGVCVYTGGELSAKAVIEALENGRFFSCRKPGTFVDLTKIDGNQVRITVRASLPIEKIELVANGAVAEIFSSVGHDLEVVTELPADTKWCIARIKLTGGDWDRNLYSFTPFMESGYAAFTNPVFFEKN